MKKAKGEIDSLYSDVAVALLALAGNGHVVERKVFELLHCPWGEHEPRYDGIEEEDNGVGDTGCHAA